MECRIGTAVVKTLALIGGTLIFMTTEVARGQSDMLVATAWARVDQMAERLFQAADADESGFLTREQFKATEPQLNKSIIELARRGALRGLPANALNAQSQGVLLPGAKKISRPEFVLEARSRASRLIGGQKPHSRVLRMDSLEPGLNAGRPRRQHPRPGNNSLPQPRFSATMILSGNSL